MKTFGDGEVEPERFVEVAVPVPLRTSLTYRYPSQSQPLKSGQRVRVPVGRRRLVGVVLNGSAPAPENVPADKIRPVREVLDREPVLGADLMQLGRFTADYYLAPIGEVFKALLPSRLEAWGARKVRLTERGIFQRGEGTTEGVVAELLLQHGSMRQHELQEALPEVDLGPVLETMQRNGSVRLEAATDAEARYETAYEIRPTDPGEVDEALARSPKARAAYDWLHAVARPATGQEICRAVDCSRAVVRRLDQLGLLRKFSEIRQRSVARHLLSSRPREELVLRPDQSSCVEALRGAIDGGGFSPRLLQGMTGSGKTEVYLRAIERVLERGAGAIVMVPEIGMVPALARTLIERFGDAVAVLHSNLSAQERSEQWQRLRTGAARVAVGPRSVVFAPLAEVGLIVVDEEHDSAYKQETTPRYNGRDLALVRGRDAGATVVLASATPSLESRLNVEREKYGFLELTERVGRGGLPEGVLVDLRKESFSHRPGEIHFSRRLVEEIEAALERREQIILLRNRRGFAPLLLCRACGEDLRCDDCGLPRTWHRREDKMLCHYCGSTLPVPRSCGSCGQAALEAVGAGTERVEDEFRSRFPEVPVETLDRDVVQRTGGAAAVLERFRNGDVRVLVGTQMVAKGHHFPNVGLVAVLSADTYLGFPDFRAVERTYNLLTQVAGRAGRGERRGRFVIQSHHPEHYAIRAALAHDDEGFAAEEMRFRRLFHYPPFTRMILLLVQDTNRSRGEERIEQLARAIDASPVSRGVRVVGPAPAAFEKLRGKWRFQLLLRGPQIARLRRLVEEIGVLDSKDVTVDVDPHDLL